MIYTIGCEVGNKATVEECLKYFENKEEIELDTETENFDPYNGDLLLVQLGDKDNQFVINCLTTDIKLFRSLLEDESKLFILHNAKFDLKWLLHNGINVKRVYDTFLAECVLTSGIDRKDLRLGLDRVAFDYLGIVLDKSVRTLINKGNINTYSVIEYAANDVAYLGLIKEKQLLKINSKESEVVLDLENDVVRVFSRIEYNGVLVDDNKWITVAEKVENQCDRVQKELDILIKNEPKLRKFHPKGVQSNLFGLEERDVDINWSSNTQKLKILKTLVPSLESVEERSLQKNKLKHPLFKKLIEFSKSNKLATSFGFNFLTHINPVTKRIHYDVYQIISTGRISVSNPNLNQIPSKGDIGKEIRSCFIVPRGYKLVGGDFSGMELRIIAQFSKDPLWVESFNNKEDLHAVLCAKTFNIPIEDVQKRTPFNPEVTYREVQKTINFGLAYGMSKFKLADTIDISEEQADSIIKQFFKVVPAVESFLNMLGNYGKSRGYIKTFKPFGRIRVFPQWRGSRTPKKEMGEIERASKNQPIQGCNGDIIKMVLVETQRVIDNNNYPVKILLSVYDEIQTECKEEFAEEWKIILQNIMINTAKTIIKDIPVVVDCKIVDFWQK